MVVFGGEWRDDRIAAQVAVARVMWWALGSNGMPAQFACDTWHLCWRRSRGKGVHGPGIQLVEGDIDVVGCGPCWLLRERVIGRQCLLETFYDLSSLESTELARLF